MSDLVQTFDGNADGLVKEYLKIQRENVRLREEQKKTADESRHHHDHEREGLGEVKEAIGEQIAELGKMAIGWLSIEKGVEAVSEALEHQRELQKELATLQEQLGGSRATLARSMLGRTAEEREQAKEGLEQIGLKAGVKEPIANQALAAALETSGGQVGAALEQVEAAATLLPDANQAPELLAKLSRQIGIAKRVTGSDTAQEALGRALQLGKQAGTSNVSDTLGNLLPRIEEMTKQGISAEQSMDFMAAASRAFLPTDSTGEAAGRFALRMSRELQHFFTPEETAKRAKEQLHAPTAETGLGEFLGRQDVREKYGLRGQLPTDPKILAKIIEDIPGLHDQYVAEQQAETAGIDRENLAEMIQKLQGDEKLRAKFLKEAKLKGDIPKIEAAQLLDAGSQFAGDFRKQLAQESTPAEAVDFARRATHDVSEDVATQMLAGRNRADVAEEQSDAKRVDDALRGEAWKALNDLSMHRRKRGPGAWLQEKMLGPNSWLSLSIAGLESMRDPDRVVDATKAEFEQEIRAIEYENPKFEGSPRRELSEADRDELAYLRGQLENFEQQERGVRANRRPHAVDAMREEIDEGEAPTPGEALERAADIEGAGGGPPVDEELEGQGEGAMEIGPAGATAPPSGTRPRGRTNRRSNAPRPAAGEEYENESLPGDVITELKKTNELLQAQLEQQRRDAGERGAADRAAGARATAAVGGGREFG